MKSPLASANRQGRDVKLNSMLPGGPKKTTALKFQRQVQTPQDKPVSFLGHGSLGNCSRVPLYNFWGG